MKTKLQLLLIACFTLFSISVMAQIRVKGSAEDMAKDMTNRMVKVLSLTKDQVPQAQAINEAYVKKALDLRNMTSIEKSVMENKVKENNAEREVAIRKVLTEKQYETYLARRRDFRLQ